jgi:hypothetical protein
VKDKFLAYLKSSKVSCGFGLNAVNHVPLDNHHFSSLPQMPNTRGNSEDTHFVRRARSDNYAPNEFAKCRVPKVMRLEADEEEKRKSVGTDGMARCFILYGRGVGVAALNPMTTMKTIGSEIAGQ